MLCHYSLGKVKHIFTPSIFASFSGGLTQIDPTKNYYKILNLDNHATLPEIKKNFYELAKQYHPDTIKGKEEEFKLIN